MSDPVQGLILLATLVIVALALVAVICIPSASRGLARTVREGPALLFGEKHLRLFDYPHSLLRSFPRACCHRLFSL